MVRNRGGPAAVIGDRGLKKEAIPVTVATPHPAGQRNGKASTPGMIRKPEDVLNT